MPRYAINELSNLVHRLPSSVDDRSPVLRYICALFSELAYYHIPQWEIDNKRRAKIIPCEAYQVLIARGVPTNLATILLELELPPGFVVEDRGAIAVGLVYNRFLFVGFRGTQFLFDWRTNLRSRLVRVNERFPAKPPVVSATISGRLHSGFGEEALRISNRILDAIRGSNFGNIDHVFLTGHSLGGAVAAISENFVKVAPTSVCIFGAPRYGDLSAYFSLNNSHPAQVRRLGDLVPTIPPKAFGYIDQPNEFGTDGSQFLDPYIYASKFRGLLRWMQFLAGRFKSHSIEMYRHELGETAGASAAFSQLIPVEKLSAEDQPRDVFICDVRLQDDEKKNASFLVEMLRLPFVEKQSRFINEEEKDISRFRLFSAQPVSDSDIFDISTRLGLKVVEIVKIRELQPGQTV
jgi:hypothetical protein